MEEEEVEEEEEWGEGEEEEKTCRDYESGQKRTALKN